MAKRHYSIHGVKYNWVINHPIIIEFTKILDFSDSSLVVLEVILLQADSDVFEYVVNDCYDKRLVISVQSTRKNGQKMNVTILDFAWL